MLCGVHSCGDVDQFKSGLNLSCREYVLGYQGTRQGKPRRIRELSICIQSRRHKISFSATIFPFSLCSEPASTMPRFIEDPSVSREANRDAADKELFVWRSGLADELNMQVAPAPELGQELCSCSQCPELEYLRTSLPFFSCASTTTRFVLIDHSRPKPALHDDLSPCHLATSSAISSPCSVTASSWQRPFWLARVLLHI